MNELNKAELRMLAEAAIPEAEWFRPQDLNHSNITRRDAAFISMAKPAAVISMLGDCEKAEAERDAALAELEALRIQVGTLTEWYSNALDVIAEVTAAIPGVTYMDLPDGGDISIQEQIRRMAKDAERYRFLCDPVGAEEGYLAHAIDTLNAWADKTEVDQAVDAAMVHAKENGNG